MPFIPDPIVEAEVSRLEELQLNELRALWGERLGPIPKCQSADLLRRRLAYELQVRAYGGMRPDIRRRLERLHKVFAADPGHTLQAGQNWKSGTLLTREWKGTTHQVSILDEGFEYSGERYQSLSEISQLITGTKWSGPAFFGLRKPRR